MELGKDQRDIDVMIRIDMIGQKFGRLTVIKLVGKHFNGSALWLCLCDCGNYNIVSRQRLKDGHTKSCGCLRKASGKECPRYKHGDSCRGKISIESALWSGMLKRCRGTNKYYGGRGISVCNRWRESFSNFLSDMGRRPSPKHSLDRIDNNKGYFPQNCRWATPQEQARNKSNNRRIVVRGKTKTLIEWEELSGISTVNIDARIRRGWSTYKAISTPVRYK